MTEDVRYRGCRIVVWPSIRMIEYVAVAQWPDDGPHPLFRIVVTGDSPNETLGKAAHAVDWLLNGPCGYAKDVEEEHQKELRERWPTEEEEPDEAVLPGS
jgi:hypothetical protein